jgi:hypothetical protein
MRTLFATLGLGLAIALVGCGPDEPDPGFCPDGVIVDSYTPGLSKVGGNDFEVILQATVPEPPSSGLNEWQIEVNDNLGDVRTDVTVSVTPTFTEDDFSLDPFPATPDGDLHVIDNIDLGDRTGPADFDIDIEDPDTGDLLDEVKFTFCIEPGS